MLTCGPAEEHRMKKLLISISIVALVALAPLALAHGPKTKSAPKAKAEMCTECKSGCCSSGMKCADCEKSTAKDMCPTCPGVQTKACAMCAKEKGKSAKPCADCVKNTAKDMCATCPGVQTKPCAMCAEKAKHAAHTHANNLHDGCQECAKACPICNGSAK